MFIWVNCFDSEKPLFLTCSCANNCPNLNSTRSGTTEEGNSRHRREPLFLSPTCSVDMREEWRQCPFLLDLRLCQPPFSLVLRGPIVDLWVGGQLWFFIEQLVRLTFWISKKEKKWPILLYLMYILVHWGSQGPRWRIRSTYELLIGMVHRLPSCPSRTAGIHSNFQSSPGWILGPEISHMPRGKYLISPIPHCDTACIFWADMKPNRHYLAMMFTFLFVS